MLGFFYMENRHAIDGRIFGGIGGGGVDHVVSANDQHNVCIGKFGG